MHWDGLCWDIHPLKTYLYHILAIPLCLSRCIIAYIPLRTSARAACLLLPQRLTHTTFRLPPRLHLPPACLLHRCAPPAAHTRRTHHVAACLYCRATRTCSHYHCNMARSPYTPACMRCCRTLPLPPPACAAYRQIAAPHLPALLLRTHARIRRAILPHCRTAYCPLCRCLNSSTCTNRWTMGEAGCRYCQAACAGTAPRYQFLTFALNVSPTVQPDGGCYIYYVVSANLLLLDASTTSQNAYLRASRGLHDGLVLLAYGLPHTTPRFAYLPTAAPACHCIRTHTTSANLPSVLPVVVQRTTPLYLYLLLPVTGVARAFGCAPPHVVSRSPPCLQTFVE